MERGWDANDKLHPSPDLTQHVDFIMMSIDDALYDEDSQSMCALTGNVYRCARGREYQRIGEKMV
jgi:hypothetical protein